MRALWCGLLASLLTALPLARAEAESCGVESLQQVSKGTGLLQAHRPLLGAATAPATAPATALATAPVPAQVAALAKVQPAQGSHLATPLVHAGEQAPGKPTFAVFTRIIKEELPYVRSFVDHYARLGVERFYLLSNKEGDLQRIRTYLHRGPRPKASFKFLFRRGGADEILKPPKLLRLVAEDYVLAVDTDEYWVLPSGVKSLHDLVAASPADLFYTKWRMVVHDDATGGATPPYASYVASRGKYMARRSVLRNLHNMHEANTVPGNHSERRDVGALVHFWGRSLADVVAKGASQVFNDCAGGTSPKKATAAPAFHACGEGAAASRRSLERGVVTQRMKVLALMMQHPAPELVEVDRALLRVDEREEGRMLQEVFGTSLDQSMRLMEAVHASYLRYKGCVREKVRSEPEVLNLSPNYEEFWLESVGCPDGLADDPTTKV